MMPEIEEPNELEVQTPAPQNSDEPKSCLFELPVEILGGLLDKYVAHEDKLRLRQVHSLLRLLIDDYIGFKVTLDNEDADSKLSFVSNLAIRKATIRNLTTLTKFKPPSSSFGEIVLYPQYLQEITVKGNIDAELYSDIIRCCQVIRTLELCPGSNIKIGSKNSDKGSRRYVLPEIDIFSPTAPEQRYLRKCKSIKLLLNQDLAESPTDINCEAVLATIKSIRSPSLERAVIQGWISERFSVSRITLIAAECLERNTSIQSLFLGIIYEHLIDDDTPITEEDIKLRPIIQEKLKNAGELLNVKKFGISTQSFDMILWKEFIKRQHNLVHVSFTVDVAEGVFSEDMFRSCRNTLSQLILRGKFITAFDFNWVEDCHKLKEICLHNIDNNDHGQPTANSNLHAVNISSVPVGLESLILFQTVARTDDITFAIKKLKLKTLVLFKTGNTGGETGVNVEALKLIFQTRSLQSILLVRFVAPNPVEAAELVKILQTMNDGQIHREVGVAEDVNLIEEAEEEEPSSSDEEPPPLIELSRSEIGSLGLDGFVCDFDDQSKNQNIEEEVVGGACALDPKLVPEIDSKKCSEEKSSNSLQETKCLEPNLLQKAEESCDEKKEISANEVNGNDQGHLHLIMPLQLIDSLTRIVSQPEVSLNNNNNNNAVTETVLIQEIQEVTEGSVEAVGNENPNNPPLLISEVDEAPNNEVLAEDNNDWVDVDSEDAYSDASDDDGVFDLDLDDFNLELFEQVADAQAGGAANVQLILNLQNEDDLQEMLGLLEQNEQNNLNNNIQIGFILDGVIDIQDTEGKRSRWVAVEDEEGHLTYTLKISID